jgi:glycine cleavage system aminomethyltransferase T/glycine/D-amino acid oxidase-like deaminating enzyme
VAITPERWEELKRRVGHARSWGVQAELIGPAEVGQLVPLLDPSVLYGAMYVPTDGIAKPVGVAEALARAAEERGATFCGGVRVTGFEVAGGRVRAVLTSEGRIAAEQVLICAGIWGPRLGRMAGVPIPLIPCQHQFARTAPLPQLAGETREAAHPMVRHQDRDMYFRQWGEGYGFGFYGHEPLLLDAEDLRRYEDAVVPGHPAIVSFTPEDFAPARAFAGELFPCLRDVDLPYAINGIFSFTPDGQSILGESPDVRGFWVAEAVWITHAGGVGQVLAEWMVQGTPSLDLRELDLNRFPPHAVTRSYIRSRGAQQYREVYDIIHPLQPLEHPRGLRRGPYHARLEDLGAVFFEDAGWERPQWFGVNERLLAEYQIPARAGWAARHWSPIAGAEHRAARERVALFDLTPFTKLEVAGPGALPFLQRMAGNQMDQPVGKVTYTLLLNERGGIQIDLTITRLAEDRFLVVTGGSTGPRDLAWLRLHLPEDGSAQICDSTSSYCCIGLWGPRARDLLRAVCDADLSDAAFPYLTARRIEIGPVPALAARISYIGELGWEIYARTEYGLLLWDKLWEEGRQHGALAAGGAAFETLRLEKGYRLWGSDMHTEYDPNEAGLAFAVRPNKGEFLGREALLRLNERGPERRLRCLTLQDPSVVLMGKEPLLDGDRVLGYVTSAGYGYTVDRSIIYGYLPTAYATPGTAVEVQYFGRRHAAIVRADPLYDPRGLRVRGESAPAQA